MSDYDKDKALEHIAEVAAKRQPYDKSRPCAKCGSICTIDRHEADTQTAYSFNAISRWEADSRIARTCQNCKFAWDEAPLDESAEDQPYWNLNGRVEL